jgi:hypothetical protein
MAAAVLIGSVPEDQVVEFQAGERKRLEASRIVRCSHILTSWVTVAPLNRVLQEAIDGGQLIRPDRWHPPRLPVFHAKTAVCRLHQELIDALDLVVQEKGPPPADDWYALQIGKVIEIFAHAATAGETIVCFLEPPQSQERASKVSIPMYEMPT